ncbi:MAG: hypothetical protein J7K68_02970 [Candidatus Diapherotrites archaeon]|nr:hypothetical protein [Candidatus Diapherotrites archaeon]
MIPTMETLQVGIVNIIIGLVLGLVWLVAGYIIAIAVETVLVKSFEKARIEKKIKEMGLEHALLGFTLTGLVTGIIKWIVFLWFFVAAVSVIESSFLFFRPGATPVLTNILVGFIAFLPVLLQGILILGIGLLVADFLRIKIKKGLKFQANVISAIVWVIVVYFTVTIALSNPAYGIDVSVITEIFNYFILALALGLGGGLAIALGLGLKDSIARIAKRHEVSIERAVATKMK